MIEETNDDRQDKTRAIQPPCFYEDLPEGLDGFSDG
jgi:hypothetical protein